MKTPIISMYDFDGTLADTMGLHADLAADCISQYFGIEKSEARTRYIDTTGIPFPEQIKRLFPNADANRCADCAQAYLDRKLNEVYGASEPFPEIRTALDMMGNFLGIPQIVSTSTEQQITIDYLNHHGLLVYFAHVNGMEQGKKPDHIAAMKVLYEPERVFFSGDSKSDVILNMIQGVVTVGRAGSHDNGMLTHEDLMNAGADYVSNDLRVLSLIAARKNPQCVDDAEGFDGIRQFNI